MGFDRRRLVSFMTFNLGWWACAWGAAGGYWWVGPALTPAWVALNLAQSRARLGEAAFLAFLGVFGFAFDTLLIYLRLFDAGPDAVMTPLWLVSMWILIGFTFEQIAPMRRRWSTLFLVGVLTGPLSYYWAEALDLVHYSRPLWFALAVHSLVWAGLMLLLFNVRDFCLRAGWRAR